MPIFYIIKILHNFTRNFVYLFIDNKDIIKYHVGPHYSNSHACGHRGACEMSYFVFVDFFIRCWWRNFYVRICVCECVFINLRWVMLWEQPNVSSKPFFLKISLASYDSKFFNNSTVTDIVTIELKQLHQLVHKIPSILHLKPTFSILHHHFYKTPISVYLFYKIFQ